MDRVMSSRSELIDHDILDLLRLAVERAPQGVLVAVDGGTIIAANQSDSSIFGYPRHEIVGRVVDDLIPDPASESRNSHLNEIADALRSADFAVDQVSMGVRQDGVPVPLEVHRTPTTVNG